MSDKFRRFDSSQAVFFLLAIITVILFSAVLKITAAVVVPFVVSVLLAIVISPLVGFLEKFRIPRIISVLLVLLLLIGCLAFMGMILFNSGRTILTLYPRYEARLREIYVFIARFFELPYDEHLSFFDNIWGQVGIRNRLRVMTLSFSNGFLFFLSNAFMVALFMAFLLFEAVFLREKLNRAFKGTRVGQIKKISSDLMTQIAHYLSIKFILSLITGVIVGVGLKIIGVEFALLWGVIQFVLNFIPNVGSIAIGVIVSLFSLIQFWPAPMPVIATALLMLSTNVIIGSIMEPKIMGDSLGLSPLIVLVSLLLWGWLWGFAGLILAVPMTAIIKIACENFPMLEPISIIMGSRKAAMAARGVNKDEKTEEPKASE